MRSNKLIFNINVYFEINFEEKINTEKIVF